MKESIDWRRVWENKSADQSVTDFELDRGRAPQDTETDGGMDEELLAFVAPQPTETLLDAGCGTGVNISRFQARAQHIIGIDYAAGAIARARRRIHSRRMTNARVAVASVTDVPLSDRCVDKVLCLSVFQFLDDDQARKALREFARVLRNDGILILHVKNLWSVYWATLWIAKKLKRLIRPGGIEYLRPYRWYIQELKSASFEIVDYTAFNFFTVDRMPPRWVSFLQSLEAKYHNASLLRTRFAREHGADLKFKARIRKQSSV